MEIGISKSFLNKNMWKCINYSPGKTWAGIDVNTCLFAWWRKDCQSFHICLLASFTSQHYGCVLRAIWSCVPSSLFSVLDDFEALAHCFVPHLWVFFCHWSQMSPVWRALWQQALSHLLSVVLLPLPSTCPVSLDFAAIWTTVRLEICFISNKLSVKLGYFLNYHILI